MTYYPEQQWGIATEPPTGSTQETIVCDIYQHRETKRFKIVVDVRYYRPDASSKGGNVLYDSGWRYTKEESARKAAKELKQSYIASEYK